MRAVAGERCGDRQAGWLGRLAARHTQRVSESGLRRRRRRSERRTLARDHDHPLAAGGPPPSSPLSVSPSSFWSRFLRSPPLLRACALGPPPLRPCCWRLYLTTTDVMGGRGRSASPRGRDAHQGRWADRPSTACMKQQSGWPVHVSPAGQGRPYCLLWPWP